MQYPHLQAFASPLRKFQKVLRGYWCVSYSYFAQVYWVYIFSVCVFFWCLLIYWVFVVVTQFVDESAKTKRLPRVLKSIYLGGRINIILQKQLSKSVQICKLFSRLEVFFSCFFFLVLEEEGRRRRRKSLEEEEEEEEE